MDTTEVVDMITWNDTPSEPQSSNLGASDKPNHVATVLA